MRLFPTASIIHVTPGLANTKVMSNEVTLLGVNPHFHSTTMNMLVLGKAVPPTPNIGVVIPLG